MIRALTSGCSPNPTGPGPSRRLPRRRTGPRYEGTTYHKVLGPNQEGSIDTLPLAMPWVVKGPRGRTGSPRPRAIPPNPRVSTSAPADVGHGVPGETVGNVSGRTM